MTSIFSIFHPFDHLCVCVGCKAETIKIDQKINYFDCQLIISVISQAQMQRKYLSSSSNVRI